jgi:hypothetical protein
MARPTLSPLDFQVTRVWRRLFLQTMLNTLVLCWLTALLLGAVWFLLQPLLIAQPWTNLRWTVTGSLAGLATLVGLVLAWSRSPSRVECALALDERFRLKERATTSLMLTQEETESPIGKALLDDANQRVMPLRVGERFPVRLPWTAGLLPAAGLLLALLAVFYNPRFGQAREDKSTVNIDEAVVQDVKDQVKQLQKKAQAKAGDKKKAPDIERLAEDVDRLSKAAPDKREEALKDVVKQMTELEAQMQKRDKELAQKAEALKAQMRQAARLSRKDDERGPADKMNRALDQGNFKRASEEADKLREMLQADEEAEKIKKQLEDPNLSKEEREKLQKQLDKLESKKLTPEQKEQLAKQLKDLQGKLERLSRKFEERKKELEEMAKRGELDPEQLERELEQLQQDLEKVDPEMQKKIAEVADKLRECQKCMAEGKDGQAAKLLEDIVDELAKIDPNADREELKDMIRQMIAARQNLLEESEGGPGGIGMGRRPDGKDGKTQEQETRARSELDKGRLQIIDHVPGQGFKGPRKPAEMTEEIREASQAAPEAIDRQRLPRSASDMAKGYFEKLRGPEKK